MLAPIEPENARRRNSRTSISGCATRVCRQPNAASPSTPTPAAASTRGSVSPSRTDSWIAYTTPRMPAIESSADAASSGRGSGLRDSGSTRMPATSTTASTGRLIRNTEPHQKLFSSAPPTIGPSAIPPALIPVQMPIAVVRSLGSVNTFRMIDRVDGMIVAPAMPSRPRLTISISALLAYAVSADATPNAPVPISSSRFRPIRSPTLPIVTSSPASARPYTSAIQSTWLADGSRSRISPGMARCSTVRSIASSSAARQAIVRVAHLRAAPRSMPRSLGGPADRPRTKR